MQAISLYTVVRAKYKYGSKQDDGSVHETLHASHDGCYSLCGIDLEDGMHVITNNTFDGEVTCKKCIKAHNNFGELKCAISLK